MTAARRSLVVLVGPESSPRAEPARQLIDREMLTALSPCAAHARKAAVLEPTTVASDVPAVRVEGPDPSRAAAVIGSLLHPSAWHPTGLVDAP